MLVEVPFVRGVQQRVGVEQVEVVVLGDLDLLVFQVDRAERDAFQQVGKVLLKLPFSCCNHNY